MTGARPIKRKRSPRPPRPRPPLPFAERPRDGSIDYTVDPEDYGIEAWAKTFYDGQREIEAKLDNGEIDAATADKLVEQLGIEAKNAARRAGKAWLDAEAAKYEASWKEEGKAYAPPAEVWLYMHCVGYRLAPEAQRTIFAALDALVPNESETEKRAGLVRFFLDHWHHLGPGKPRKRLTWTEALEVVGKIRGVSPHTVKKSYQRDVRGLPPELRRRNQRKKPG
jgi:hypothetical protein